MSVPYEGVTEESDGKIVTMADWRRLALATRPGAWRAAAAEQAWRLRHPSRHCSSERGDGTVVYWPTEYQHPNAATFVEPLRLGLERVATVERLPLPQPYRGIVSVFVQNAGGTFPVAIDYYDRTFVNDECLARSARYFKMQFLRSGYHDPRIVPGGYVAGKRSLYRHYRDLRRLRRRPSAHAVYGRFGTRFAGEIRRKAVAILEGDSRIDFAGGTSPVLYMQSLREAARARICIDLPGNGPLCYRLVEYLAIGCCIVAPRHRAAMHAELRDGEHLAYCQDDLSDLSELCLLLLARDDVRETMGANAARFFDEHLRPVRLARHYLRCCQDLRDAGFRPDREG